jgi:hypothetical protein
MTKKAPKVRRIIFKKEHFPQSSTRCFRSESDWQEYRNHALVCMRTDQNRLHHPCMDCLPEFQADMIEVGRCDFPNTKFREMHDCVVGVINEKYHFGGNYATPQ